MFSFKGFQTQDKNTHLEHPEDDIINRATRENAINFLKSVRNMLKPGQYDRQMGRCASNEYCVSNPENSKFFVGAKSVFNKTPKINYTTSDIRRNQ